MTKAIFAGVNYDVRNGTSNKDTLLGGLGNDWIKGGAGNDIIIDLLGNNLFDGGAGSDTITGGIGRDTFIHRMSENAGSRDRYEGAIGTDTLRLELTAAEWARADVQADIAAFLAHTSTTKNKLLSLVGLTTDFSFRSMDLTLSNIEKLDVFVDGVAFDPKDDKVIARGETLTVSGSGAQSIDLLANDSAPDRVASVSFASIPGSAYGQIAVTPSLGGAVQTANLTFTPNAAYASLKAGEVKAEIITYTVKDVDGDTATATATIRIVGVNDAPVAYADAATTDEDTPVTIDVLTNDTDVDGDTLSLVSVTAPNGKGSASIVGGMVVFDPGQDFQGLNAGQYETVQLTYSLKDPSGAQSSSSVTVTINGADDGPVWDNEFILMLGSNFFEAPGNSRIVADHTYGGTIVGDYFDIGLIAEPNLGDDLINAEAGPIFGDTYDGTPSYLSSSVQFGNDTIILTSQDYTAEVAGEFYLMYTDSARSFDLHYGNDVIDGSSGGGLTAYGDTFLSRVANESQRITFGNDVIIGSDKTDLIYGDTKVFILASGFATFGNDTITGGRGDDLLFGDTSYTHILREPGVAAGNDVFVFAPNSGHDTIGDFGYGADRLDVPAYAYANFDQIVWFRDGNDTVIDLDGTAADIASVRLLNYTDLKASDFIFA